VSSIPDFFALRGDGAVRLGQGFGCACAKCDKSISAPFGFERALVWCLYCGMECGHVPLVEIPMGAKFTFGVTLDECREIDRCCATGGDLQALFEKWAKANDQILFTIG